MKSIVSIIGGLLVAVVANLSTVPFQVSYGQEARADEEVVVTGSRIRQDPLDEKSPILNIDAAEIDRTGLTSIGDFLQRLSVSGSTLNTRFNSSGNFGFPPDGSGVGAGASQVDLRHLSSKRVLVLVDGIRWVNGSSASGVAAATDLNTIPVSIIERIEVLEDGASAIYGSDAIAGVVNIITKKDYDGFGISAYVGDFSEGGGTTNEYSLSMGSSTEEQSTFFNFSYTNQEAILAADVAQARESAGPGTTNLHGSSGTPQGRYVFSYTPITDPNGDPLFINATLNDGTGSPFFDPLNPIGFTGFVQDGFQEDGVTPNYVSQFGTPGDDYHRWSNADRFNFAPFNYVVTPSERTAVYGQSQKKLSDDISVYVKGLYNNRRSVNQAAPEPLFIGSDAGNGNILDTIDIDVTNPYNPFGISIIAADQSYFMGRRPLEGGPRVFQQDVDTWYAGGGLTGSFEAADQNYYWDVNVAWSRNQANQMKTGGYNARKLKDALGPAFLDGGVWRCGTPGNEISGCVPFNFFGGQGADGSGTITPEMLSWVGFTQQDSSEQELVDFTANISGGIMELPGGTLAFAAGLEHREQDGTFQPDSIVVAGDSAGIPAQPTSGGFDVDEYYVEVLAPLISGQQGADLLELSAAARSSDYSTFGSDSTTKLGLRWRPTEDLLLRFSVGEGLRAPSIGELFGSQSRFDATIADPCSDFNRPEVSQAVRDNCIADGVPSDGSYVQLGGQISVLTGGNRALRPETVDSTTFGVVYSPPFVEGLTIEAMFYEHDLDRAIQAVDAQTILDSCANTGEAQFCNAIGRTGSGVINSFSNQLTNIGGIETNGWDLNVSLDGVKTGFGEFAFRWSNTFLSEYTEILLDPSSPSGFQRRSLEGVEVNDRGKPEWKSTFIVNWLYGDWSGAWTLRYIDEQIEACSDFLDGSGDSLTGLGLCSQPNSMDDSLSMNKLEATAFNDVQFTYTPSNWGGGVNLTLGINNILEEDPPACYSCSLNGYDPSTYDNPGRFTYLRASWKL